MAKDKVKLTDTVVARAVLPDGKTDVTLWDSEVTNFGLRLRPQSKTWIVSYRPSGAGRSANSKKFKLGTPETIATASEARRLARDVLGRVARGEDPGQQRDDLRVKAKSRVVDLLDEYEKGLKKRGYVGWKGTMSALRRGLKPHFNTDIRDVKGSDYVAIVSKLEKKGLEGAAETFRSRNRAFLTWCLNVQKVIETHPTFAHRKEKPTRSEKLGEDQHGRALSDQEIYNVWQAAPDNAFGRYLKFLILTGCRRTEASLAHRNMLAGHMGGRVLRLPKEITKSGRDHNLPITPQLQEIFKSCAVDGNELFFPSPVTGGPMSGWTKMVERVIEQSKVEFTLHDLRRTLKTGLAKLGVDSDTSEICLNHSRRGLEKIYNRNEATDEMRDAFTRWAKHISGLIDRERERRRLQHVFVGTKRTPSTLTEDDFSDHPEGA